MLNAVPQWRAAEGALKRFVLGIWSGGAPAAKGETYRILPDGSIDLTWELHANRARTIAFGNTTAPRQAALSAGAHYVGVRFRPGAAHHMIDHGDFSTLTDSDVPSALKRGPDLAQRLGEAPDFERRVALIEAHLLTLAADIAAPDLAESAANLIVARRGQAKVDDLSAALGVTRRHLERQCRRAFGLSPKMLARITRFRHAAGVLSAGKAQSGADLAAAAGYVDQAHLIREFQEFAGTTPKRFRS